MGNYRRQDRFLSIGAAIFALWGSLASAQTPRQPASANPRLRYALILTRHGVRAPTWTPERLNQYSAQPWPDFGVPPAELTVHGRKLMTLMGGFYQEFFTAAGLLGKPGCDDALHTWLWADTDQRTLETARALAEGLTPGCKSDIHSMPADQADALFNPAAAGAAKPDAKLATASVLGRIGPSLDAITEANKPALQNLDRLLKGDGKPRRSIFDEKLAIEPASDGVGMTGPLRLASTFTENLLLEYTNGMTGSQFGWGRLDEAKLLELMSLHTNYAELLRRTPYLAAARGSNLLSHIVSSIERAVTGKPVVGALGNARDKLTILSGHDTNISNLSAILGLSWTIPSYQTNDVPPGGALVFTLWRNTDNGPFFVRLQLVAQTMSQMNRATPLSLSEPPVVSNLFVPGCSTAAEGFPCQWEAFRRVATRDLMRSPTDNDPERRY